MEDAVNPDVGSAPAAVETPSSEPVSSTPAPTSSAPTENAIPYSRVKEMVSKRERELSERYERELAAYKKQAEGWGEFTSVWKRSLGLEQPPKPEYVDKNTFETQLNERIKSLEQKNRAEREYEKASAQLEQAKAKYPDAFNVIGFEDYCIEQYRQDPNKSLLAIADEAAAKQKKYFETLLAKQQAEYAKNKEEAAKTVPVKSGGGVAAVAPAKEKLPKTRAERETYIQRKLRSYKNGE